MIKEFCLIVKTYVACIEPHIYDFSTGENKLLLKKKEGERSPNL